MTIKIKKLNKINELFTDDGSNTFEYDVVGNGDYEFTDSEGKDYIVTAVESVFGRGFNVLDIKYDSVDNTNGDYKPQKGQFNKNKAMVLNTVISICRNIVVNKKPVVITFSGEIDNGLASLYRTLIKSLKLSSYDVYEKELNSNIIFDLIRKDFKFIFLGDNACFNDGGNIVKAIGFDPLFIYLTNYSHKDQIDFDFYTFIKYYLPSKEEVKETYFDDGYDFAKFQIHSNLKISKDNLNKANKYLKSIGLQYRNTEDNNILVYVNLEKLND